MRDLEIAEAVAREALKAQTHLKKQLRVAWVVALVASATALTLAAILWGCA